jgi:hypothetical protein
MIDSMAKRYGLLPSEVMCRATTFDMVIMDTAQSWINHQQSKNSNSVPDVPLEELEEIMKGVRG